MPRPTDNRIARVRDNTFVRAAVLLLLSLVIYFPAIRGEFLWDDNVMLTQNPFVKSNDGLGAIWFSTKLSDYLPQTSTSFWLEWKLWGMNPTGYHVTNILLHGIGACLVWRILRRLRLPGAWLAALVFTLHPVCVASVAWITERKNTLSFVFFAIAILCYLRYASTQSPERPGRLRWYWFSLAAFVAALLSKSSIIMLPVVLLGLAWWQNKTISRQDLLRTLPFFLLSLIFAAVTIWFQFHRTLSEGVADHLTYAEKTIAAARAIWFYFFKIIWPANLAMIYPQWKVSVSFLACVPGVLLLALFSCCWKFRNTWGRPVLLGVGYFVVMLFPVLGFFDMYFLSYSRVADHWQYAPLIGITTLLVSGGIHVIERFPAASTLKMVFGFTLALWLGTATWKHAHVYATSEALWNDTLTKNPDSWAAHSNLAVALDNQGRIDEAIAEYERTLQLHTGFSKTHYGYAVALEKKGRTTEAAAQYAEALRLEPNHVYSLNRLGTILAREGKNQEARELFEKVTALRPEFAEAQNNLANLLATEGKLEAAISHYTLALKSQPAFPEAHNNLAMALQKKGDVDAALSHFRQAASLRPDYLEAQLNVATLLLSRGNVADAKQAFERALRLNPAIPEAHYNLALILNEEGNRSKAAEHFSEALRLKPDFAAARSELDALGTPSASSPRR